ncbi:hypothetical protein GCM10008957_30320 [Deinococcus ruber]|uniref:Uncharacterized protein n=1 Tax=Deinococcus ruber TaxID=1848197 RepID=A0A918CCB3_9DEIO|nr:hypothetical protein GCM10008957_30320 [Deinococcus ruber]
MTVRDAGGVGMGVAASGAGRVGREIGARLGRVIGAAAGTGKGVLGIGVTGAGAGEGMALRGTGSGELTGAGAGVEASVMGAGVGAALSGTLDDGRVLASGGVAAAAVPLAVGIVCAAGLVVAVVACPLAVCTVVRVLLFSGAIRVMSAITPTTATPPTAQVTGRIRFSPRTLLPFACSNAAAARPPIVNPVPALPKTARACLA